MSILSSLWNGFLESLLKESKDAEHPPMLYSLLKQLRPLKLDEEKISLGCTNQGLRFFLEKKTIEIEGALSTYSKMRLRVELVLIEEKKKEKPTPLLNFQPSLNDVFFKTGLHAKYSFDNFAVSSTNQVAFAAAQAVSNGLGSAYNPLFLYGGVGVGKTHLAQSIGRKILEKDQEKKVLFCPGESFTNEMIEAIRENSTPRFRRRYRRLDLLMVDDVQFIAGKNAVQEEFFHTFNSIVSSGGQIVLTSDKPPSSIKNLEDRLRSRFLGGLMVDVQPPDFELRSAILLIKAQEKNIDIDIEAAKIMADQIRDTRELEGVLLTLYSRVLGKSERIDVGLVDDFFSKNKEQKMKKITPNDVLKKICSFYNVRISHLKGESRNSEIVLPRQIAMYLLRKDLGLKLEEVAFLLKKKDHTTVIHAIDKIERLLLKDSVLKEELEKLSSSFSLLA